MYLLHMQNLNDNYDIPEDGALDTLTSSPLRQAYTVDFQIKWTDFFSLNWTM